MSDIKGKYSNILECPCEHPTHVGEAHLQEETGCPYCNIFHDEGYLFSNAEVKDLINQEKLQLIEQIEKGGMNFSTVDYIDGRKIVKEVPAIPLSTLQKIKEGLK